MELLDTMLQRRSIRKYEATQIPEEKLNRIIQAGLLAPSSRNIKPCEFYVVRDKDVLGRLASAKSAGGAFLSEASAAIVVAGDSGRADTWIEDSSIALTYMNLMAVDQGVGSCWVQIHLRKSSDGKDAEDNVRDILDLPENLRIVGILSLGLSAQDRPCSDLESLDYSSVHNDQQ